LSQICEALPQNKSIRYLDISGNVFDKKSGGAALLDALKKNSTLRNIGVGGMGLGKEVLCELSSFVKESRTLKGVYLRETVEFKLPECVSAWITTLSSPNCQLEEISFAKCSLSPESIQNIFNTLTSNTFLKKLDMSENKLGKQGLIHLATALQKNLTLQSLTLRGTDITPALVPDFVAAMDHKNITLRRIEIGDNPTVGSKSAPLLPEWRTILGSSNSHFQFFL